MFKAAMFIEITTFENITLWYKCKAKQCQGIFIKYSNLNQN